MNDLSAVLAAITGLATTTIIGFVKALEQKYDTAIVSRLGNVTPVLVVALNILLPKLWVLLHLPGAVPDATIVASAPLGAVISILAREAYVVIFHKAPPAAPSIGGSQ